MKIIWNEEQCKVLSAVDGDTIDVRIDVGFYVHTEQRLRLLGVDTPERGQPGYREATEFVAEKTVGKRVYFVTHKGDKYGRFLTDVFYYDEVLASWRDLALELVARGYGKAYHGGARG
jgi:micrococcal nuclease